MTNQSKIITLAAAVATVLAGASAQAQNPGFAHGDLILGFRTTGSSTPASSYLLANLGQSGTLRDVATNISLINLGAELSAQFGATWFNRTDLYVGLGAVGSNDEFNGYFVNGDPDLTVYVSAPRQSVGTAGSPSSPGYGGFAQGQVQDAANGIFASANIFETTGTSSVSTLGNGLAFVDWDDQNPVTGGVQGAAFNGTFPFGVQAVFGAGTFGTLAGINAEAALDLYRIQGFDNVAGQFGFGLGIGYQTFEGTVVIDNGGQVSLITTVPEPTSFALLGLGAAVVGGLRRRRTIAA